MTQEHKLPACHQQIQILADELRLTQQEMARSSGIARTAVSNYFQGKSEPRFSALQRWGQTYSIDMNWFFYGQGDMIREPSKKTPDNLPAVRQPQLIVLRGGESGAERTAEITATADRLEAWIKIIDRTEEALIRHGASPERIQEAILNISKNFF